LRSVGKSGAQLLVDQHQIEIRFRQRLGNVDGALRRMQGRALQPVLEVCSRERS